MPISNLPSHILDNYEVHEWRHASAILQGDFQNEWDEIIEVLTNFQLLKSDILRPGGRKSPIAAKIDGHFESLGWKEKAFDTKVVVDGIISETPTHSIDCLKNRVALEIEWNNKDPFYDRDLNNFRLLFELRAVSVGIIITRCTHLQQIFRVIGKGDSYGTSTTHMNKLLPRIEGGGGGGCPILVFGISEKLYIEDI